MILENSSVFIPKQSFIVFIFILLIMIKYGYIKIIYVESGDLEFSHDHNVSPSTNNQLIHNVPRKCGIYFLDLSVLRA